MSDVTRCGCWAHARRKFFEALPEDENLRKTSKANIGFEKINKIFALEREFEKLDSKERYKQRQERTKKVLDDFFAWLSTLNPSKGSGLTKAVQYALNEKQYLYAFFDDPDIPVDNNMAERAVKPFVIGRKN